MTLDIKLSNPLMYKDIKLHGLVPKLLVIVHGLTKSKARLLAAAATLLMSKLLISLMYIGLTSK